MLRRVTSLILPLVLLSGTAKASAEQFIIPDIGPVVVTMPAERVGNVYQATETDPPPPPSNEAPAGLSNCQEMSWYRQRAGLPAVFDSLGYRESNCRNEEGVHTFCCYGYWQLWISLHVRDGSLADAYAACGVSSRYDVDSDTPGDKRRQACATKALYDKQGLSPWR
jgi:hypothetical protein